MRRTPSEKIDRKAITVWMIASAIQSLILWAVAFGAIWLIFYLEMTRVWLPLIIAGMILQTVVSVFIVPWLRWKRWHYEVSEHEVDLQYGVWWIRRTLLPMVRVQHVETVQGPLMRTFGLAGVTVSTAGGSHEIPALSMLIADGLRDRIADLAKVSEDDV